MDQLQHQDNNRNATTHTSKKEWLGWLSIIFAFASPIIGFILALIALSHKKHNHTLPKIALAFASPFLLLALWYVTK